jgi:aminocarboxymuconate-semialdehyde decarboxylase
MKAVDVHGHYIVPELLKDGESSEDWRYERQTGTDEILVTRGSDKVPCIYEPSDPDEIVHNMDVLNIDVMAINTAPFQMGYELDVRTASHVSRVANESLIGIAARHPSRLVPMATLPMQDTDAALQELDRLRLEPSVVGVELGSNVNGAYLGEGQFWPIWAALADLNLAVFVHPVNLLGRDRLNRYFLANLIGNPVDSTRSIADIVFSGLLDEYPNLRICFAHGGGAAPGLVGRWDHGHEKRIQAKGEISGRPSEYLKKLYFDHITHSELSLRHLIDLVGSNRVMIGSDYPFDMGPDDPVRWLDQLDSLTEDEIRAIKGENASQFLGLSV